VTLDRVDRPQVHTGMGRGAKSQRNRWHLTAINLTRGLFLPPENFGLKSHHPMRPRRETGIQADIFIKEADVKMNEVKNPIDDNVEIHFQSESGGVGRKNVDSARGGAGHCLGHRLFLLFF
jgi:hypothetical protein